MNDDKGSLYWVPLDTAPLSTRRRDRRKRARALKKWVRIGATIEDVNVFKIDR